MSHGIALGVSYTPYTYSHATDEQSALGLFYNGNNPLNLRSGYALSDFDRKHVLNFTYTYELPKFFSASSIKGKVASGWAISGLTVIQSGQPYSVVDYSGAVGQRILWCERRHYESHLSALRLHAATGCHRDIGREPSCPRAQSQLFWPFFAGTGRIEWCDSDQRPLRDKLYRPWPAQYLPAAMADSRGQVAREGNADHGALFSKVQVGRFQSDKHHGVLISRSTT